MICTDVQNHLSLFLYGELTFAEEEDLEQHLAGCEACTAALQHEENWHKTLSTTEMLPGFDLLAQCRSDLSQGLQQHAQRKKPFWERLFSPLSLRPTSWSMRLAVGTLLLCAGFSAGRLLDRRQLRALQDRGAIGGPVTSMGLFDPADARIRSIENTGNKVQIVLDQTQQRTITGNVDDAQVHALLLVAMRDINNPGIRVDSVDLLKHEAGQDVRDALLTVLRQDPNPGVRLRALGGLRGYAGDAATRETLSYVLSHDDNPGVRIEAINTLVPEDESQFSPQLAGTLQDLLRSERNEYIRLRCQHALSAMNASVGIY